MSKPAFSISGFIGKYFTKSSKAISETLTTEQYNEFTAEAATLASQLNHEATETAAADGVTEAAAQVAEAAAAADQIGADPAEAAAIIEVVAAGGETAADLTAQVTDLTAQITLLQADKVSLMAERDTVQAQITTLTAQLQEKDTYISTLKQSINPLADEDASNASIDAEALTETDRQARANKARREQANA